MKKKHNLPFMKHFLQCLICPCRTKESSDFIKHPSVEFSSIFISKVFLNVFIHRGEDMAPTGPLSKHWQDIRASPCPCVTAFIEGRIKLYWIFFPTWKEETIFLKWVQKTRTTCLMFNMFNSLYSQSFEFFLHLFPTVQTFWHFL